MPYIRAVEPADTDSLYRIALLTGASGQDASHLYTDGMLVGHIWAAPYALLEPGSAFVAIDDEGVAGYIVGAADTQAFAARLEAQWWPALRQRYAQPQRQPASAWTADERAAYLIHRPPPTPAAIVGRYPSHLHINLLPRLQGKGMGAQLISHWLTHMCALGSRGVHFGVSPVNFRALAFYRAYGFAELPPDSERPRDPIWFTLAMEG